MEKEQNQGYGTAIIAIIMIIGITIVVMNAGNVSHTDTIEKDLDKMYNTIKPNAVQKVFEKGFDRNKPHQYADEGPKP
jgi:hypothetical protein